MGIEAPIVMFKQFRKFISVPGGKAVSDVTSGPVSLLGGALAGKLAVLLYDVKRSMKDDAR